MVNILPCNSNNFNISGEKTPKKKIQNRNFKAKQEKPLVFAVGVFGARKLHNI
jgi:hypothetical protein